MPRQNMILANPKILQNENTQTRLLVDYVYISDTEFQFHSVQGNIISVPYTVALQNFLIQLENDAKAIYDVP